MTVNNAVSDLFFNAQHTKDIENDAIEFLELLALITNVELPTPNELVEDYNERL